MQLIINRTLMRKSLSNSNSRGFRELSSWGISLSSVSHSDKLIKPKEGAVETLDL